MGPGGLGGGGGGGGNVQLLSRHPDVYVDEAGLDPLLDVFKLQVVGAANVQYAHDGVAAQALQQSPGVFSSCSLRSYPLKFVDGKVLH